MTAGKFVQICLRSPTGTDGPGLAQILQRVLPVVEARWAVLSDVDLVGPARSSLATESRAVRVLPVGQLLTLLQNAQQVVWANVFLCRSKEAAEQITGAEDYVALLKRSEGLVRVVDATYYYVYGPVPHFANLAYELGGEQTEAFATNLDFPE